MSEIVQQQDTRREFIDTLCELAKKDDKIVLILCDTGFNYIEKFKEKFPNRIFNFGVTEQSSVIISASLALMGLKPYFYSMIPFVAFRPFEMVRNIISQHNANVKVVGVKGSEKYKMLGFSHNMLFEDEDTYHLKPYMDTHVCQTNEEVKRAIRESYASEKPCYIRL